jgi:hypothetical protein
LMAAGAKMITSPPRPLAQTKSPRISTLNASLSVVSRPASPLLVPPTHPSLSGHSGTTPESAPQSPTSDEDGDKFYDADENLIPEDQMPPQASTPAGLSNKPKRASGLEQAPPDSYPEGASKGRMGVTPSRSRNASHAVSNAVYYAAVPGRGSSKPTAAPSAPIPLATRTPPPPASEVPLLGSLATPVRRALLVS